MFTQFIGKNIICAGRYTDIKKLIWKHIIIVQYMNIELKQGEKGHYNVQESKQQRRTVDFSVFI